MLYGGQERLHSEIRFEPCLFELYFHCFGNIGVDCWTSRLSQSVSHKATWASCSACSLQCGQVGRSRTEVYVVSTSLGCVIFSKFFSFLWV